jgi:hypothetical protein
LAAVQQVERNRRLMLLAGRQDGGHPFTVAFDSHVDFGAQTTAATA